MAACIERGEIISIGTPSGYWFNRVAFAPDGKRIVSVSEDTTVRLWEAATGTEMHSYPGHKQMVTGVAFTPDGKHIVSGGGGVWALLGDERMAKVPAGGSVWTFALQ